MIQNSSGEDIPHPSIQGISNRTEQGKVPVSSSEEEYRHAFVAMPEKKEVTWVFGKEYLSKTQPTYPAELPGLAGDLLEE